MTDNELEAFLQKIYDQQKQIIAKNFGEKASLIANYGWYIDSHNEGVTITTKVYSQEVLKSTGYYESRLVHHELTLSG